MRFIYILSAYTLTYSFSSPQQTEVDRSMLEEYLNIEKEIAEEEANNPIQPLELKADQLSRLEQEIETMEHTLSQLEEQT